MKRAFTLIELLTVIAITAILMTIILIPVIQSFNMTRAAQGFADAQDKARTLTERIAHEINGSAQVRDNTGLKGELDIVVPARPGSGSALPGYDTSRPWIRVPIYNAKIDLVKPFEGDPSNFRNGAFVDPTTGLADPTLHMPKGQPNFPASPGMTIVRYFVGLQNPVSAAQNGTGFQGYNEPYSGLLQAIGGGRDNLYVLFRAEVSPYIWSNVQGKFVVNKAFFYDLNRDNDPTTSGPLYDDPTFFDPTVPYPAYAIGDPDGTPDPTKEEMVRNWMRVAAVQTEVTRFDMIQPVYDLRSRQVVYDGDAPRLVTLIQFRPTRVSSEPAEGQMAVRLNQETDNAAASAPDVYVTRYGGLSSTTVRTFPGGANGTNGYVIGHAIQTGLSTGERFSIYYWDPATDGNDDSLVGQTINGNPKGLEIFDVTTYLMGLKDGIRFNFSRGIAAANSRSGFLNNFNLAQFVAYIPDFNRGRLNAGFGIDERGQVSTVAPYLPLNPVNPANPSNLPGNETWPDNTAPLSPFNDPNLATGVFSDAAYTSINKRFNKVWHDMAGGALPDMRPSVHRYIDLRVTPNDDGTPSPLDPRTGYPRAHIVPGSEQVFGPDQNPGPNYGRTIRYTRTTRDPGPNQYRINYSDLQEPNYSLLGLPNPPAQYTPADFVSAVIQPRYKVGYLQLNSDPNVPLPGGDDNSTPQLERAILVFYRFQFTLPQDTMAVDYDSRQLMTVALTIRNYPQSTIPNPQTITLRSTATVRNFLR